VGWGLTRGWARIAERNCDLMFACILGGGEGGVLDAWNGIYLFAGAVAGYEESQTTMVVGNLV
jgi:hypothetical protein